MVKAYDRFWILGSPLPKMPGYAQASSRPSPLRHFPGEIAQEPS
jgi:hypothetical protein